MNNCIICHRNFSGKTKRARICDDPDCQKSYERRRFKEIRSRQKEQVLSCDLCDFKFTTKFKNSGKFYNLCPNHKLLVSHGYLKIGVDHGNSVNRSPGAVGA